MSPELLLRRAEVYETLGYADLAVADAYVAFAVAAGDEEDLRSVGVDGEVWDDEDENEEGSDASDVGGAEEVDGCLTDEGSPSRDESSETGSWTERRRKERHEKLRAFVKRDALSIIVRGLGDLGCGGELPRWQRLLQEAEEEVQLHNDVKDDNENRRRWTMYDDDAHLKNLNGTVKDERDGNDEGSLFGFSRREIYPWNEHEPDRLSDDTLEQLNGRVLKASDGCLEVRRTVLPRLSSNNTDAQAGDGSVTQPKDNAQLGLFALRDLPPSNTILREHSILTAIRPHDAPLCDACAADLHSSQSTSPNDSDHDSSQHPETKTYMCPGCNIPFCSQVCLDTALSTYHVPNTNDESTEAAYPPSHAPFCPGTSAHADIHELGRAEGSEEPEWDLYFLLAARCIMMAETRGVNPLDMEEVKWLWGEFNDPPVPSAEPTGGSEGSALKRTLPFSLHHTLTLPNSFFKLLLLSRPTCAPYSTHWLRNYDFWILQTLYAKFRGVADAKQSTWDGKPESAGVYGLWCLANHGCGGNVEWETRRGGEGRGGERVFEVRERVWRPEKNERGNVGEDGEQEEWEGIKKGEEIWNHYTDVREDDFRVRRRRLREVLGGDCMCERCVWEEKEWIEKQSKATRSSDGVQPEFSAA